MKIHTTAAIRDWVVKFPWGGKMLSAVKTRKHDEGLNRSEASRADVRGFELCARLADFQKATETTEEQTTSSVREPADVAIDLSSNRTPVVSRSWWKSKSRQIRRVEPQLTPAWRRVPEDDAMESDSRSAGPGKGALEELMGSGFGSPSRASSMRNWTPRWARHARGALD